MNAPSVPTPPLRRPCASPVFVWLLHVAAFVAIFAGGSRSAVAQETLVVAPGAMWGISLDEASDLVEESAFLAEDHGGFAVTRYYELAATLRTETYEGLLDCGGIPECYADALYRTGYHHVLVVTIEDTGTEVFTQYQVIDVRNARIVSDELATLAGRTDFGALQGPCLAALEAAVPRRVAPAPVVQAPPTGEPLPLYDPVADATQRWERPERGRLGQAGIYTAIAGGVVVFGGVLLGFSADDIQQEIQAAPRPRSELESLQQQGETRATLANTAFVLGGLAVATGVSLVIVDSTKRRDPPPMGFNVRALPSSRGVLLRAEF